MCVERKNKKEEEGTREAGRNEKRGRGRGRDPATREMLLPQVEAQPEGGGQQSSHDGH